MRQPGISKMIQALERDLGARLLERRPRGVETTPAGAAVVAACERIFDAVTEMEQAARAGVAPRGELFIGTSDHVATYLLPAVIARLREASPLIVVRVLTGAAHLLLPGVAEGRPEVGLFFTLPPLPGTDRSVVARAPCQLVVARRHAKDESVLRSFIGSREIEDPANRSFPALELLRQKRPETSITVSSSGLESHKELVRRGLGISILPLFMVEREVAERELVVIEPSYVFHADLEVVAARGRRLSPNAAAFLVHLKAALRERGLRRR
jgi:LysR family hydrogen peroxide-inducible transcriptional activator